MEEAGVGRRHEQDEGCRERGPARDRGHGPRPAEDGQRVHARERDLGQPRAADPHRNPRDERRDRRTEHLERGERGITVGELEERRPVVPRVPSSLERPRERLDGVARERGEDEEPCAPTRDETLCAAAARRAGGSIHRAARYSGARWSPRGKALPDAGALAHDAGAGLRLRTEPGARRRSSSVGAHAEDGDEARPRTARVGRARPPRRSPPHSRGRGADDASAWDVPLYQSFGDRMAGGAVPYRDFRVEYPPGSLPAFLLPSLVAPDGDPVYEPELNDAARGYARAFAGLMTVLLGATVIATALSLGALRVTVGHAAAALGLVGATPLLLGELALTRFDALPVALTAVCVAALLHGRSRLAAVALGLAVAAKLYPLLLVPLVVIYVHRRSGRREAALAAAITAATCAAVVLPFLALAPGEAWFSIRAQLTRGVQVESVAGNLALRDERRREPPGARQPGCRHRRGRDRRGAKRRRDGHAGPARGRARRPGGARHRPRGVGRRLAAAGRSGTPRQGLRGGDRGAARAGTRALAAVRALARATRPARLGQARPRGDRPLAVALVATHAWFPDLYRDYVNERGAAETGYLLARNALLLGVLLVLVAPTARSLRSPSRATAAKRMKAGATGTA